MESVESQINGRFRVISGGSLPAPGNCAVCGSTQRDCVDFGLTVDYFGAVLLCTECLASASRVMGSDTTSEALPISPLNFIDADAINEYVKYASDSIGRLTRLLDSFNLYSSIPVEEHEPDEPNIAETSVDAGLNDEPAHRLNDSIFEPFKF